MAFIFQHKSLNVKLKKIEKLLRPEIYSFLNHKLKYLLQKKAKNNKILLSALKSLNIKWYKFRGLEEIEAIPITQNIYADEKHNPLKYRKSVMSAALRRILAWHRCSNSKVIGITPNKGRIKDSGFTKSSRILNYPQDFGELIRQLNKHRNYVLAARPAILAQLAFYIHYNKCQTPTPRLIIAFNHDFTVGALNLLKETFSVPLVRLITDPQYGSIIATCRYKHYHLFEPVAYHEIVNSSGVAVTNGRGQLVVTPLYTNKPSLIRYNTGIEVIPNKNAVCSCGLSYRTIDNISYTMRPTIKGMNNSELLIPLSEELHENIVGVNYEQSYGGEVLITIKEHIIDKLSPNDYKAWFANYWKQDIRITIVVDNRSSFIGDRGLSNFKVLTNN